MSALPRKDPPTKEMLSQLKFYRNAKSTLEAEGDITAISTVERLEREVGDWTETIDYSQDKCLVLPNNIHLAARNGNIQKVLDWLGPLPVDKQRINAKNPEVADVAILHSAVLNNNSDLLSILLQLGADVDPVDAAGATPLAMSLKPEYNTQARLLLEWGAEISNCASVSKDGFIQLALKFGNSKLANLLKSEFGGRRCEIIDLPKHPDLIGKTCLVEKYLPDKDRYKVVFEASKEVGLVGPENLKRRDRTPDDCGYYISHKNDRFSRNDFASKEECKAFVASLTGAAAEARAEEAAEALLAELSIESSADSDRKSKGGKKKGEKKGRK